MHGLEPNVAVEAHFRAPRGPRAMCVITSQAAQLDSEVGGGRGSFYYI